MFKVVLVRFACDPGSIGGDTEELQVGAVLGCGGLHEAVVLVGAPLIVAVAVGAV